MKHAMGKASCTVRRGTALLMVSLIAGCRMGTVPVIPNELVRQAEPGATLTALVTDPGRYRDKIVILGGVVLAEKREASQLWLLLRNRPLDADYAPIDRSPLSGQKMVTIGCCSRLLRRPQILTNGPA